MERIKNEFGFLFWLHLTTLAVEYASPFLFSWKIVLLGASAIYLQWLLIGNCFITLLQFHTKSKDASCNYYYLRRFGFHPDKKKLSRYLAIFPALMLLIAIIWQVVLGHTPLFH